MYMYLDMYMYGWATIEQRTTGPACESENYVTLITTILGWLFKKKKYSQIVFPGQGGEHALHDKIQTFFKGTKVNRSENNTGGGKRFISFKNISA